MPEGHTLFRLAREQSTLFAGRPVHVTSPQGRFAAGAALLDGRVLEEVFSYGKHLFARLRRRHPARPPGPVRHVHRRHRARRRVPRGALRMRWEGAGPDGTGVWADLRGPTACEVLAAPEVDGDPGPARARPAAPAGRPGWSRTGGSPAAGRRSARCSWTSRCSPASATSTAPSCSSGTASPRSGPAAPSTATLWARMWADLVTLMRAGVRLGRIVTTRPEDRSRRRGRGPARGRALRLPADRAALPGLRHRGAHRGDGRPQPLLVPGLPGRLTPATQPRDLPAASCQRNRIRRVYVSPADETRTALRGRRRPGGSLAALLAAPGHGAPRRPRRSATTSPTRSAARRCPATAPSPSSGSTAGCRPAPTRAWPPSSRWAWGSSGAVPAQPRAQLYLNTANPGRAARPGHHLARRPARRPTAPATAATRRPAPGSTAGSARRTASSPSSRRPPARPGSTAGPAATPGGWTSRP